MAKGQPKKKKARNDVFTVNLHFDGIFTSWPLKYAQGQVRGNTDTNFDEMSYEHLKEIAKKLVPHALFEKIYYSQTGVKLTLGLREIKSTQDIAEMMKVGDESVVIKSISTHDPFLTKLCSARIMFRGTAEHLQTEEPLADHDDHQIHAINMVQSGVLYPAFDPDIPWDKMEPTLGMRYETPYQLKLALANYSVAHGYQLWYMKNDWREVLVYCGRNVEEGRCAGKKGNKDRVMKNKVRSGVQTGVKKKVVKKKVLKKKVVKKKPVSDSGEGTSQSPKWTKKQIRDSKQVVCPFRMYASWMSNEHSFQIKSLNSEHKCCRNYNLGSLVTFRTAKQLALFDHEGGLIEHYGKLYQYRQALLDSNPGSTCRLDVENLLIGSATLNDIHWELLTAMGRDANNQMYPIAWAVVRVENADNWGWFLHLLHDDLSLNVEWELQYNLINKIKQLDGGAYDYLIKRNPNSWSKAFFEMDRRCATFENEISESFNKAILEPRHKPIITMLEETRLYIMQRLVAMNKIATNLQDTITPSIRKREWLVIPSGFQELEVRKDDQSYGVNLSNMWKRTNDVPPLPLLVRRMLGRPQKSRIKDPGETSGSYTSRWGIDGRTAREKKTMMLYKKEMISLDEALLIILWLSFDSASISTPNSRCMG
ncbi:hypothetical protein Tco_0596870 [Tanacetum coccineum]